MILAYFGHAKLRSFGDTSKRYETEPWPPGRCCTGSQMYEAASALKLGDLKVSWLIQVDHHFLKLQGIGYIIFLSSIIVVDSYTIIYLLDLLVLSPPIINLSHVLTGYSRLLLSSRCLVSHFFWDWFNLSSLVTSRDAPPRFSHLFQVAFAVCGYPKSFWLRTVSLPNPGGQGRRLGSGRLCISGAASEGPVKGRFMGDLCAISINTYVQISIPTDINVIYSIYMNTWYEHGNGRPYMLCLTMKDQPSQRSVLQPLCCPSGLMRMLQMCQQLPQVYISGTKPSIF